MHVKSFVTSALVVLAQGNSVLGAPAPAPAFPSPATPLEIRDGDDMSIYSTPKTCTNPIVRKEWRALSSLERLSYIAAVMCLQLVPGKTAGTNKGVRSRYDDYQAVHIRMTDFIHFNGFFHPWHRQYLAMFEADLRRYCGYQGGIPYWDWTLDAVSEAKVMQSPVFDSFLGFGGNGGYIADVSNFPPEYISMVDVPGRTGGGCVTSGIFSLRPVSMGPGNSTAYNPHCLRRDISPWLITQTLNSTVYNRVLSQPDFFHFTLVTEGAAPGVPAMTTHGGGHLGVGGNVGEIANMYSSPGDPLFFLHHSQIDRTWDKWQKLNWPARKSEIAGPDTMFAYPFDWFGPVPYQNVTLNSDLNFPGLGNTIKISDVMDTQDKILCYKYV
ncbi:hypothetical protein V8F33_007349 [Rhypophila sp. PSN 637]